MSFYSVSINWEDLTLRTQDNIMEVLAGKMGLDIYGKDQDKQGEVYEKAKQIFPVDTYVDF